MRARIDRIEALLHQDVGRGANTLFAATEGGLYRAAAALAAAPPWTVGLLTGFFVARGDIPAAETDGPAGAALLALAFARVGIACRLLTDRACATACAAALDEAGIPQIPVDAMMSGAALDPLIDSWHAAGITWTIAIERCGQAADGRMRTMRGDDLGPEAVPLDRVFSAGPWRTIGIGDGGNEVGMGALPAGLIATHVPHGAAIACVTPAEFLVTAGVSHWAAYGLIAALALLMPAWRPALLTCLDAALDERILRALVARGPAVDGVTLRRAATIDGLEMAVHHAKLAAIRGIVENG